MYWARLAWLAAKWIIIEASLEMRRKCFIDWKIKSTCLWTCGTELMNPIGHTWKYS